MFFIVGSLVVVIVVAAMWLFSRRQGKDDNGSRYHVPDSGSGNSGTGNSGTGNSGLGDSVPYAVEVLGGAPDKGSGDGLLAVEPVPGDDSGTEDDARRRSGSRSPRSALPGFHRGFGGKRKIMGGR